MIVLCDASPLRYLVVIGEVDVLVALYHRVLIPASVAEELNQPRTPSVVRDWISHSPPWLEVRQMEDAPANTFLRGLDRGERDALYLALNLNADLVVMDEREAVAEARKLGLKIIGTIGILDLAAREGLVDLADAYARLLKTNFRVAPSLIDRLLAADRKRRRG